MENYSKFINENYNKHFKWNGYIDYTLLDNNASDDDIIKLCEKADKFGVKSVCVMPKHVKIAATTLEKSKVLVCTVISFPEGTNNLEQKIGETYKTLKDGADEVDMVLNYPILQGIEIPEINDIPINKIKKSFSTNKEFQFLISEVSELVDICHTVKNKEKDPVILKVIVESGALTEEQTKLATIICIDSGADFIKTSTGKISVGAEANKIKVMKDVINDLHSKMKIKASGGVRTENQIETFEQLGTNRFGMGWQSVDLLNGLDANGTGY